MERWTSEDGVQKLFDIFLTSQKLILHSLDYHGVRFTKYQFYLMMELSRGRSLTMSQAAASVGCSKEQATRMVSALVEAGYIERFHSETNRKLVIVRLTEEGENLIRREKSIAREKMKEDLNCLDKEERDIFFQTLKQFNMVLKRLEENQEKRQEAEGELHH